MNTLLTILRAADRRAQHDEDFMVAYIFVISVLVMMALAILGTGIFIVCYHMLRWAAIVP